MILTRKQGFTNLKQKNNESMLISCYKLAI